MRDEAVLDLRQARHPVLEELLGERFVPNDCALGMAGAGGGAGEAAMNAHAAGLALITGPNMAGKSTYIRMVALVTLLAHAGSFVPATAATIGVTDRIFTRIGADDALHAGQSTFMVEMVETAAILNHASGRSLVILDEIGRGTSTLDGLSLAWAVAEYLAGDGGGEARPRTLFATHYHEVTDLADRMPERVVNLQVAVREWEGQVIFLHRILPGRASRSYGIHVARLAGLPRGVVERADVLLESLSVSHGGAALTAMPAVRSREAGDEAPPLRLAGAAPRRQRGPQLALFGEAGDHPALIELKKLDINSLSPMQAFDALRRLLDMTQR
jgi:DNA mismatch repair protein MutS